MFFKKFYNGGISIDIIKNGKVDYLKIDIENIETVVLNEDTIYLISSITKPIFTVNINILVVFKKIKLKTSVKDILHLQNTIYRYRNNTLFRIYNLFNHCSKFFKYDRL